MGAKGKLVAALEFPTAGDVFHQVLKNDPHSLSTLSPGKIQGCAVHEGEFGTAGSIIFWNYTHDGKEKVAKERIEVVDDEKKLISFRVIEGDLLEEYKELVIAFHVETKDGIDFVTWTIDFETLNQDVEPPYTLLQLAVDLVKDIETAKPSV